MPDISLPDSVTKGFVSYRRADNADFRGVADQLRDDIGSLYEAMTGKRIELFLDRESIGWGEDWRQKIEESVRRATVFIPVITMRYFTSEMCMEELTAFHASAARLGVTDLLLPIVLFGADQIRDDDPRSEVQLVSRLNYKNIQPAWTAGYESPAWREELTRCVVDLDQALRRAEDVLSAEEATTRPRAASSDDRSSLSVDDDDDEAGYDLSSLTEGMEKIEPWTNQALEAMNELGRVAGEAFEGLDTEGMSPGQINARLLAASRDLRAPAVSLEETAQTLNREMLDLDANIRGLVTELSALDLPEAREQVRGLLGSFQGTDDLAETETEIASLIQMLQLVSLMNVSVRKALKPAIRGLRAMSNAVAIFRGWQELQAGLEQ